MFGPLLRSLMRLAGTVLTLGVMAGVAGAVVRMVRPRGPAPGA